MSLVASGLSETGCTRRSGAVLVNWGARVLYVGPAFGLAAHRNAVAVLAIGLSAPLGVARDPCDPTAGYRSCRSALIEPNALHHLQTISADVAFLYVDPLSRDLSTLRSRCRDRGQRISFDIEGESALIELLCGVAASASWASAGEQLAALLALQFTRPDPRVDEAIRVLRDTPGERLNAAELASRVGLSASRFQHLFKQATGVPFRRFRTWTCLRAALVCVLGGGTLTRAAHEAGFASSAHLSSAFKQTFGMAPTQLLASQPRLIEAGGMAGRGTGFTTT